MFLRDRHYDLLYKKDPVLDLDKLFDVDKELNNWIIEVDEHIKMIE